MKGTFPIFPTALHAATADLVVQFFADHPAIDTILAVNSCARGLATPESDLDFAILAREGTTSTEVALIEADWHVFLKRAPVFLAYQQSSPFAHLHLDVILGEYEPQNWDEGGGPDYFEVEIGNQMAYSAPMGKIGSHFQALQSAFLPFYDEDLRNRRLEMVCRACIFDLYHVQPYVRRGLHFQAFDRLYKAHQTFLQALFIRHATYPLAYNKWIRAQVVDLLGLPDVYKALVDILSIPNIESPDLEDHAEKLRQLLHAQCMD